MNVTRRNFTGLNAKDAKDYLPMDPTAEAQAVSDYEANGIHLHAAGAIYFQKDDDDDIRAKFEYCKRAGVKVILNRNTGPATRSIPRMGYKRLRTSIYSDLTEPHGGNLRSC